MPVATLTRVALTALLAALLPGCRSADRSPPRAPLGRQSASTAQATGGAAPHPGAFGEADSGQPNNVGGVDAGRQPPPAPGPAWATWPMPNPPRTHLPNPTRYAGATPELVEDAVTGLIWQRPVDPRSYSWRDAGEYCEHLALAGFTDWRLPTRIELVSLIDVTQSEPSIDRLAFPDTPVDWFWTSSAEAANPEGAAWTVYFHFGHTKAEPTNSAYRARCVRTPPGGRAAVRSETPLYVVRDEVVRDLATGLDWQRAAPVGLFTHPQARCYCGLLRLGNQKWRVPTMGELLTVVDERTSRPAIDGKAFPDASPGATAAAPLEARPGAPPKSPAPTAHGWFWTSSAFADSATMAWQVSFEYGNTQYGLLKEPHRVRCVH